MTIVTLNKSIDQCKELIQNRHRCRTCAGFYAPSSHACDGCEHYSEYRPVDNEVYKNFTYE